jgi:hypothetical protein
MLSKPKSLAHNRIYRKCPLFFPSPRVERGPGGEVQRGLIMFESASPDTFGYLILGLVVVSAIVLLLVGSMAVRYRSLQKDLQTLDQLRDE